VAELMGPRISYAPKLLDGLVLNSGIAEVIYFYFGFQVEFLPISVPDEVQAVFRKYHRISGKSQVVHA